MRGDYRIGDWLVHPRMNSMERNGDTVHFEPKVMQVLLTLASEPGEVVTREHLRKIVWPDVFVGEDVLIRAISELRRAFSDDPRDPHTIQTIPKVGYRLVATVEPPTPDSAQELLLQPDSNGSVVASPPTSAREPVDEHPMASPAKGTHPHRRTWIALATGATLVLLVALTAILWRFFAHHSAPLGLPAGTYTSRPLTTYPGSELQPSFSPDGGAVAFVWIKEGERNGHIYVKMLGSEAPAHLTSGSAEEFSPAWSPDGRWIAFVRHDENHTGICVIPAIGGSEEEIYTLPTNHVWEYGSLTWTSDGKSLIFPQQSGAQAPSVLVELTINGRALRVLTSPPQGWDGDWTPDISPDGKQLAFVRGPEGSVYDIYIMTLPNGKPRRITNDGRLIVGLTWSADSSSIIFASNRSGSISLWRVSAQGGTPEHEPVGGDNAYSPSIAKQGGRLVYAHGSAAWSILAVDVHRKDTASEAEILTSSEQDASPHVSPSGDKIAFQSWRSGSQEIWKAGIDGTNPIQLTSISASAGSPFWSHDGRHIAFDARLDSFAHIYLIGADGGSPHPITSGNFNDIVPSWSNDDQWIFFGSNRSGSWQVWKARSDGSGTAEQVTHDGGMVAQESADGKWLYFTHYAEAGLWRMSMNGGPEQKVFDGPPTGNLNYWTLNGSLLYSLAEHGNGFTLQSIDPETRRSQTIYSLRHAPTPFAGMSLTPDGKRIIFAELDRASSGLTLVEHYD